MLYTYQMYIKIFYVNFVANICHFLCTYIIFASTNNNKYKTMSHTKHKSLPSTAEPQSISAEQLQEKAIISRLHSGADVIPISYPPARVEIELPSPDCEIGRCDGLIKYRDKVLSEGYELIQVTRQGVTTCTECCLRQESRQQEQE